MKMRKYFFAMTIGIMGVTMLLGGCAKKAVKPESDTKKGMTEERVTSTPEVGESALKDDSSGIKETDVSSAGGESTKAGGLVPILFDFDKFNIRGDMRPLIESNSKWLMAHTELKVSVEGHADERGTSEYNLALGERRAQTTKRVLISLGVPSGRLSTISYGEERPSCTQSTESCYSTNRRAQFSVRGR